MIPWEHLATAAVPGGGDLKLMRRGAEYSIMAGSIELMNSRLSGSEVGLATLACERVGARKGCRVLIGGLGMGFTLRAALAHLPPDAKVTVAELVPAVVDWARGPMSALHGSSLEDPRVSVHLGDVGELMRGAANAYDAILLDVDNGPDALSHPGNDGLYSPAGLASAWRALTPGGLLAVWSAAPDFRFAKRLRNEGYRVEERMVRAHRPGKGAKHTIWLAERD